MKVLITSDWYFPVVNGVVRSILNLKEYLEENGHEVYVLTLSNGHRSYKKDNVYYIGSVDIGRVYPDARLRIALKHRYIDELIEKKCDIIHSQCEFSTFFMAKKIQKETGCPLIHTYHTIYEQYTHYFSPSKRWGKKVVKVLSKKIMDRCDYVVAPTQKTFDILRSYNVEEDKMRVIATGINIRKLHKSDVKKTLGIEGKKMILFLGRLAKEKNIDTLIDYYKRLDGDYKFVIVGGGPYGESLKQEALGTDIIFTGMIDPKKVSDYYLAADVFVSASTSETQGLTYNEALAHGLSCLCKEDDCLKGVLIDGFNGYRFNDFEGFKDGLHLILDDDSKREEMEKNAYKYALDNFSITAFGEKMIDLYDDAISKQSMKEVI